MAGPNQHHIPQLLQRGFGVKSKNKPKYIWVYSKSGIVEMRPIKETASEYYFYAGSYDTDASSLDDNITKYESERLGSLINKYRDFELGSFVSSDEAVEIISYLAPRSSHFRDLMHFAFDALIQTGAKVLSEPQSAKVLLGIDGNEPGNLFKEKLTEKISEIEEISGSNIPFVIIEKIAFFIVKEKFDAIHKEILSSSFDSVDYINKNLEPLIKDAHNKSLSESIFLSNRRPNLEELIWTLEESEIQNFILPDCIAIALDKNDHASAFITSSPSDIEVLMMPISSKKILVGRRDSSRKFKIENFNINASSCAESFFLASCLDDGLTKRTSNIGESGHSLLNEAITSVVSSLSRQNDVEGEATIEANVNVDATIEKPRPNSSISYQITLEGEFESDDISEIADKVGILVGGIHRTLPLNRLDGITFSTDYLGSLIALDRGYEGEEAPSTITEEIGIGVAQAPLVIRNGEIKNRVIVRSEIALALISDDSAQISLATHTIANQLAEVALTEIIDSSLPGVLLGPFERPIDSFLYPWINPAILSYFAARSSAGFDFANESLGANQSLLLTSLKKMESEIPEARLSYRFDGDLNSLLELSREIIKVVLMFSARILGHSDGVNIDPFFENENLKQKLVEMDLYDWFRLFDLDLKMFWQRRDGLESIDDLFYFNRHVERLYWQVGIIPWEKDGGDIWVEVPLGTDAEVLFKSLHPQSE